MSSFRPNPLTGGFRRGGFTPNQLSGLAAWYKASSLVSSPIDPGSLSGVVSRYRADSITGAAPNTIANCVGWYRADLGITLNGSNVSKWADQSGNGHDLIQNTSTAQPGFTSSASEFGNQAAVTFNASQAPLGQWMSTASNFTATTPMTVVVIGDDDGTHAGYAGTNNSVEWFLTSHLGKYSAVGSGFCDSTVSLSANTPRVFTVTIDGSNNGIWYINGGTTSGTGNPGIGTDNGFTVGGLNNTSGALTGKIVEFAFFNRALTQAEVQDIQTYASIRYKIAVTNTVRAWNDTVSGDATHNLSQSVAANTPSLNVVDSSYANTPSLSFVSGSLQRLQSSTWTSSITAPRTILAIGNFDGTTANQYMVDAKTVNQSVINNNTGSPVLVGMYSGGTNVGFGAVANTPIIAIAEFGATASLFGSSNTVGATGNSGTAVLDGLTVGAAGNATAPLNGKITEIVVFNRLLTTAEINGINAYASARYGINLKVASWSDSATPHDSTHDVAQSTYAAQPTLNVTDASYNQKPTVSFASATHQTLASGVWSGHIASPYTIAAVYNSDGAGPQQLVIFGYNGGVDEYELNATDGAGGVPSIYSGSFLQNAASPDANKHATIGIYGSSGKLYTNAKTVKASGSSGTNGMQDINLGAVSVAAGGGGYLNGKIAEVIIYNRALTQSEVSQVLSYLGNSYNIVIGA